MIGEELNDGLVWIDAWIVSQIGYMKPKTNCKWNSCSQIPYKQPLHYNIAENGL